MLGHNIQTYENEAKYRDVLSKFNDPQKLINYPFTLKMLLVTLPEIEKFML